MPIVATQILVTGGQQEFEQLGLLTTALKPTHTEISDTVHYQANRTYAESTAELVD